MKIFTAAALLFFINIGNSFSQTGKLNKDTIALINPLLFFYTIDGGKDTLAMGWPHFVADRQIKKKTLIDKGNAINKYGDNTINGAVIYTYKKGTQVLTFYQFLRKYKIAKKYWHSHFLLDGDYSEIKLYKNVFTSARIKKVTMASNCISITTNEGIGKTLHDLVEYMNKTPFYK